MPSGILTTPKCDVKASAIDNSIRSKILDNLEINDVLEIIKLLLNYIMKIKKFKNEPRRFNSAGRGC